MLLDQTRNDWSADLLDYAGLRHEQLPKLLPSGSVMGYITKDAAELTSLPVGLPCVLGGHDHLCGAFASGGTRIGKVIDSSGTACALLTLTNAFNPQNQVSEAGYVNYPHVVPGLYVLKGGLKAAGRALDWISAQFNQGSFFDNEILTAHYNSNFFNRPLCLPFFHGSGTPDIHPFNRASFIGLSLDHSGEDMAIALFEGLGFWMRENLDSLQSITGRPADELIAIGGTNQNSLLRQVKASITGVKISAPTVPEASAVGASLLAAVGTGSLDTFERAPEILDYPSQLIYPDPVWANRYRDIYEGSYLPAKVSLLNIISKLRESK